MLTLKKIAVTGGIGCGKSSVCRFLEELGAYVINADDIVHQLLTPTTPLGKRVIEVLGLDIVVGDTIDRRRVAEIVFNQAEKLRELETLLHPAVFQEIDARYQEAQEAGDSPLFVAEIALLFETGAEVSYDQTIAVIASEEACKERMIASDTLSSQQFLRRSSRQLSNEAKATHADHVIVNDGSLEELQNKTQLLYPKLLQN